MITTTSGERFTDIEQEALATLMFRRFGREEIPFCDAWRRMLQNSAENAEIMKLVRKARRERQVLLQDIRRYGTVETRDIRLDLLDTQSCAILRRHLQRIERRGEQAGQRKQFRQPWRRP